MNYRTKIQFISQQRFICQLINLLILMNISDSIEKTFLFFLKSYKLLLFKINQEAAQSFQFKLKSEIVIAGLYEANHSKKILRRQRIEKAQLEKTFIQTI